MSDVVLFGVVGGLRWDSVKERFEKGLLVLRKGFGVFVNVCFVMVESVIVYLLLLKNVDEIDFVVVCELIGGIYFFYLKEWMEEVVIDIFMYYCYEIECIVLYVF